MLEELKTSIYKLGTNERRELSMRYFKTGKGEYGEGDVFIGLKIPDLRKTMKPYIFKLSLNQVVNLLHSKEHEFRLAALLILVERYRKNSSEREDIVNIYCSNTDYVNNWDLVDSSAHVILGPWLEDKDRQILYDFANSGNLWKERIAIMSTFHFIKRGREFKDTFNIAEILLNNREDLIHKAVGWMLREIGKISIIEEENFLKTHYNLMPRTMLRYAIEKFPTEKRMDYLKGRIH